MKNPNCNLILVLLFNKLLFFFFVRKSKNKTGEEIDDAKRDQTINVLNFLVNMISAIALSPFEISNESFPLSFLLTAGIFGNLLVARYSYARGSLSQAFVGLTNSFLWTAWSLYLFNGKLKI